MPRQRSSNNKGPLPNLLTANRLALGAALGAMRGSFPEAHLVALDPTCGNGHDACFMAVAMAAAKGPFSVIALDIQQSALDAAARRAEMLPPEARDRLHFVRANNADIRAVLDRQGQPPPDQVRVVAVAVYNLGFLPGSDKRVITTASDTLASLDAVAEILAPGGLISVHAYGGHPGGQEEMQAVQGWSAALPEDRWTVMQYRQCNKSRNPETLLLAWRHAA